MYRKDEFKQVMDMINELGIKFDVPVILAESESAEIVEN